MLLEIKLVLPYANLYIIQGSAWGDTWVNFCWVCAAGLSEPDPIIVYSVAIYRPHLCHFWPRNFLFLNLLTRIFLTQKS